MAKTEHTCANHPDVKTRRKCFQCSKYICGQCQIVFLNRTFCSFSCLQKALFSSFLALLKPDAKKSSFFHYLLSRPGVIILWITVIFMFVSLFLAIKNLNRDVKLIKAQRAADSTLVPHPEGEGYIQATLKDQPDAMVRQNIIDISGEAADSIIISLKVNGQLKAVTLPKDNQFSFSDIELEYGSNEIVVLGMDSRGNVKVLQRISTTYGTPTMSYLSRDVTRGRTHKKRIALTFDGGSGKKAADDILNVLKEKDIRCTMFLTGAFLKRYPDLVKEIFAGGHEVGNHTWSHPHLTTFADNYKHQTRKDMTREKLQQELLKTAELFQDITKQKMALYWRAPFGEHNLEIRRWAAEIGYRQIGWTIANGQNLDTMDWVADTTLASYKSSDEILQELLKFGNNDSTHANGGIILMHLHTERQTDPVHTIIPAFVDSMRARGYAFTTISKLLKP